jgi:hypothetical protein
VSQKRRLGVLSSLRPVPTKLDVLRLKVRPLGCGVDHHGEQLVSGTSRGTCVPIRRCGRGWDRRAPPPERRGCRVDDRPRRARARGPRPRPWRPADPYRTVAGLPTIATHLACLPEQADSDGQIELGPRAIGGQNLGGRAVHCQGQAAAIAQRQPTSTGQGPHCPGQFGIGFGQRLDRDASDAGCSSAATWSAPGSS